MVLIWDVLYRTFKYHLVDSSEMPIFVSMISKVQIIRDFVDSLQDGQLFIYDDITINEVPISYVREVIQGMCRSKKIIRISNGIFQKPKFIGKLGPIPPHTNEIAKAISRKYHFNFTISAEAIENQLGISTQCVSNPVFVANIKREKVVQVLRRKIRFMPFSKEYEKFKDARILNSVLVPDWIRHNLLI